MPSVEVSVIVVSYGTRDLTLTALTSVRAAGRDTSLEAIVVDNASPDGSADAIERDHPWVTLLRSSVNRGFASAANQGARTATGEWLLFLNSDAVLHDDSLPGLLAEGRKLARPGALGPRIEGPAGTERSSGHFYGPWRDFVQAFRLYRLFPRSRLFEGIFIRRVPREPSAVDWLSGACLMVRRDTFLELDGFDEAYFLYVEDMDLCYRLRRRGLVNLYVPEVSVDHGLGRSPRPSGVLLEGGAAPEYFVRKFQMRYPFPLQRFLRCTSLVAAVLTLGFRGAYLRLRSRETGESDAWLRLCLRSLGALLREGPPRSTRPESPSAGEPRS